MDVGSGNGEHELSPVDRPVPVDAATAAGAEPDASHGVAPTLAATAGEQARDAVQALHISDDAATYLNGFGDGARCWRDGCGAPAVAAVALGSSWGSWNELLCLECLHRSGGRVEWAFATRAEAAAQWVNSPSQQARLDARRRGNMIAELDEADIVAFLNALERRPRCAVCTNDRLAVEVVEYEVTWSAELCRALVCGGCLSGIDADPQRSVQRRLAVWSTPAGEWQ